MQSVKKINQTVDIINVLFTLNDSMAKVLYSAAFDV